MKRNLENFIGKKFARLTIIAIAPLEFFDNGSKKSMVMCRCDCGNIGKYHFTRVKCGHIKSCGCYKSEIHQQTHTTHNRTNTPLYNVWRGMKARCHRKNDPGYKHYGGRGIRVCDRWINDPEAFMAWALANNYSKGLDIDRINVDGDYEPDNCRFVTRSVNNKNRRSSRIYQYNGKTKSLSEWAKIFNIKYGTLYKRMYGGLKFEEAININNNSTLRQ